MPTFRETIEAHAAEVLATASSLESGLDLSRFKNFLKAERHNIRTLHRSGAGGRESCGAQAAVIDIMLRHLLESAQARVPGANGMKNPFALVAIGGYGRGELNPHSDLDIMFLHSGTLVTGGKPTPGFAALMDGVLYPLWDIGLKVGHSVRSIDDCVGVANSDIQSKTSLIEARLVSGNLELFQKMQGTVLAKCVRGFEDSYVAARVEDQETRRAKFGNSACLQEPNIKNGCGGLRDYQNLLWMAFFKYRVRTLKDLQERRFINETELAQLESAYDFLLRVRNELHYQSNRPVDVLTKNLQPVVAWHLEYTDPSPRKRLQRLMRDIYTHMRHIYLITRTLEQRLALLPKTKGLPSLRQLIRTGRQRAFRQLLDGFIFVDGEIQAAAPGVFEEDPRRLMRVFLHAQHRGCEPHPDLIQTIRNYLVSKDADFLQDRHIHQTFLEILNQRGSVAPILRSMHEIGLLGRYFPEFGKLTCLVQHEFYHQYTADEHTLVCLEKLDEVWSAKEPPLNRYTEILQRIERPFILYLALLLHDAGKAYETGDHARVGAELALNVARRMGLDGPTTQSLQLLIEHHLLMVQISQRRDLDDPTVVHSFAATVQSQENLDMLTLHTLSDSRGTSDQLWNGFKDSLLLTLHFKTSKTLAGGTDFVRAEEAQREQLAQQVREIMPVEIGADELQAHFDHLPPRYFQIHSAKEVLRDVELAHRFMKLQVTEDDKALEPAVAWHEEPDRGFTEVDICTWDRPGLFTKIAGCLTASGLNIHGAQIFSRTDGIILDAFFVTDAQTGLLPERKAQHTFEEVLRAGLKGAIDLSAEIARQKKSNPFALPAEEDRIQTMVHFDNQTSDYYTIIDMQTEDRLGLLYVVSQTLAELHLEIAVAKICTENGAACDSFYVVQADSRKITSEEYQEFIAAKLRAAVASLDLRRPGTS